ncbi:MAG: C4-type zinc ribbon domain-containing protein [Actinomycetota bacterium]
MTLPEASRDELHELLELQKIDSVIDRLHSQRRNLAEQIELERLTELLTDLERAIGEQHVVVDEVAGRQSKLDDEIEMLANKITVEEQKLYAGNIQTPKELLALQSEVESLKRRRLGLEDSDLVVMEEREGHEKHLAELEERAEDLRAQVGIATAARDTAMGDLKRDLDADVARREQWAPRIGQELLSYYEQLRTTKGGVAAAALADGTCEGCHLRLPAQELKRVRDSTGLVHCDECRRILVVT